MSLRSGDWDAHLRIVLIGQAPGANTNPLAPLWPRPEKSGGGRLFALTGFSERAYIECFERYNLLNSYPGRTKRDDKFPKRDARIAAQAMLPLLSGARVVLVGRNVAEAFQHDAPFFMWCRHEPYGVDMAVIPHPSGRNSWYRKAENREEAVSFFKEFRMLTSACGTP